MKRRKSKSEPKKRKLHLLQCQFCFKFFEWPDKRKKYCPTDCQKKAKKEREKKRREIIDAQMRDRTKAYLASNPDFVSEIKTIINDNKKDYVNPSFSLAFYMMRANGWKIGNNFKKYIEAELKEKIK